MVVGFDLDGVIIDHTENKIKKAKELGYDIKPEETSSQKLKSLISPGDYRAIQKFIYGKGTFSASPMQGALEILNDLRKNYSLVIISRRMPESRDIALDWLREHDFLKLFKNHIYFVDSDNEKDDVAKKLKIAAYVDDKLKVLRLLESVPNKILFDPLNCFFIEDESIKKIKNWQSLPASLASFLSVNS